MATILVVDDRPINRRFLVTLLGYANHRLLEAADGEEALALTRAERPDLVITDIIMPRMDGYEFVRQLREDQALAGTRVIFYTATYRAREARSLAQAAGVAAVLSKPSEPGTILGAVNAALGVSGPALSPPTLTLPAAVGPEPFVLASDKLSEHPGVIRGLSESVGRLIEQGRAILEERDQLRGLSDRLSESLTDLQSVGLQLSTLIELGLEAASEREPMKLLETSCRAAKEILSAKYAAVGLLDPDQQHLSHFITRSMGEDILARLGHPSARAGVLGKVLADRRPQRVHGLNGDPQAVGLPAAHPPIHSFLAVPIASRASVYGWLYVADKLGAEAFSDSDEQVALTLATQLAVAYENIGLYDEIQRHAVQLELEVNQRKRAEEALRTLNAELEWKVGERTAELGKTVETLQVEAAQRQQAEAHLQRTNRTLRMLSACDEALVRIDDERRLMQAICRIAVEIGGYRMAWVGLADNDADQSVRPVASAGFEAGYLESARISWADTERGQGPTGTAIRLGRVQIGTDFLTEPRLAPWRAEAIRCGFRSSIALPLRQGKTVVGALTIFAPEPTAFPDAQVTVLLELAEDLAFGIHAARVRTALRESRDRLRALAGELTLAEHRERRRVAQVLHDHLQQLLVGAKIRLTVLCRRGDGESSQEAKEIEALVEESLTVSRSLTAELSPPILNEAGWTPALEWLTRWMAEKHGLAVALSVEPDAPAGAGDVRVLLYEAVRELLFNVVKHAGVKTATVTLRRGTGGQMQIVVADPGVGFDPATVTSAGAGGVGFGLFSIRERLDLVGGQLKIESAPGQGSRFTLTVPLGTPPGAGSSAAALAPAPVAEPASQGPSPARGAKIRVLMVDDHKVVRQGLARLLAAEPDIEIVGEAADGKAAVELARQLLPDVVTMDISMPGMNGIEATRAIQAECPAVRVIGLSIFEEAEQAKAMRSAGAVYYLTKSAASDALLAAIRACADPLRGESQGHAAPSN